MSPLASWEPPYALPIGRLAGSLATSIHKRVAPTRDATARIKIGKHQKSQRKRSGNR